MFIVYYQITERVEYIRIYRTNDRIDSTLQLCVQRMQLYKQRTNANKQIPAVAKVVKNLQFQTLMPFTQF